MYRNYQNNSYHQKNVVSKNEEGEEVIITETGGSLTGIKSKEGETIEEKVFRISSNKEPIKDGARMIYTDRKEGVIPSYNIRTDRFDVAIEAMEKAAKTHRGKREERHNPKPKTDDKGGKNEGGKETGGQPIVTPESPK